MLFAYADHFLKLQCVNNDNILQHFESLVKSSLNAAITANWSWHCTSLIMITLAAAGQELDILLAFNGPTNLVDRVMHYHIISFVPIK